MNQLVIEPYPGFRKVLSPETSARIRKIAEARGVKPEEVIAQGLRDIQIVDGPIFLPVKC